MTDYLRRATAPRLVVAASRLQWPSHASAALRRALGQRPCIELFFAYDDPYAAIALPGLLELARAHKARLVLFPLGGRGIAGDPAQAQRRRHAVEDSRRLARRSGRELMRREPLAAQDCAFLAAWTAAAQAHPSVNGFAAAALEQLWFRSTALPTLLDYAPLYKEHFGIPPPGDGSAHSAALARNTARLHRLGHWESPAARVEGEWFFAHERLAQIGASLLAQGW
ncbi:MAG: hypothetical protein ACRETE_06960 [Stenotrophobium sp.]